MWNVFVIFIFVDKIHCISAGPLTPENGCCCQVIKDRVTKHVVRSTFTWNTEPGSLVLLPEFSQSLDKFPFYWRHLGVGTGTNSSSSLFTAVVYITSHSSFTSASPLHRLMRALSKSSKLHKAFWPSLVIPE